MNIKQTALSSAVAVAMGVSAGAAQADIVFFNWTGVFTMINGVGTPLVNSDSSFKNGYETQVNGMMAFNNSMTASQTTVFDGSTITLLPGSGAATVMNFSFFGGGNAVAHDITMQSIGDGHGFNGDTTGAPNTGGFLVSGDMLFDWNGTNNIVVEIVLNAGGFFTSTGPVDTLGTMALGSGAISNPYQPVCTQSYGTFGCINELNDGPAFMATVDGNPFAEESVNIFSTGGATLATNLNRHTDGFTGIAMDNGPFPKNNANFDILTLNATGSEPLAGVPVPAALWLFGSGLLGLVGVARRKK